jgi:hypothetical protein
VPAVRQKLHLSPCADFRSRLSELIRRDDEEAARHADEAAAAMARKLEHTTPAEMGYGNMTPEELIASERQAWLEEEKRLR